MHGASTMPRIAQQVAPSSLRMCALPLFFLSPPPRVCGFGGGGRTTIKVQVQPFIISSLVKYRFFTPNKSPSPSGNWRNRKKGSHAKKTPLTGNGFYGTSFVIGWSFMFFMKSIAFVFEEREVVRSLPHLINGWDESTWCLPYSSS